MSNNNFPFENGDEGTKNDNKPISQDNQEREPEYVDLNTGADIKKDNVTSKQNKDNEPKKEKKSTPNFDFTLVDPDYDSDFDVLPLPSEGKTYKNKKDNIKISYLTAGDENILTNPNLVKSGKFLDILFQKKIIDKDFNYLDLLKGDVDAIMLWLRATAYGPDYTIQVMDPETLEPFDVEIDLNEIKTKNLGAEPDDDGLFDFKLPLKGNDLKFSLLTVRDDKNIEHYRKTVTEEKGEDFVDLNTFTLKTVIKSIDGNTDKGYISNFCNKMRLGDSKAFKKYVESIESGKDFNLKVSTPGGGHVTTFFPFNRTFFWPES